MPGLLHVPIGYELVGFFMMAEVTIREEDALDLREIWEREE